MTYTWKRELSGFASVFSASTPIFASRAAIFCRWRAAARSNHQTSYGAGKKVRLPVTASRRDYKTCPAMEGNEAQAAVRAVDVLGVDSIFVVANGSCAISGVVICNFKSFHSGICWGVLCLIARRLSDACVPASTFTTI